MKRIPSYLTVHIVSHVAIILFLLVFLLNESYAKPSSQPSLSASGKTSLVSVQSIFPDDDDEQCG